MGISLPPARIADRRSKLIQLLLSGKTQAQCALEMLREYSPSSNFPSACCGVSEDVRRMVREGTLVQLGRGKYGPGVSGELASEPEPPPPPLPAAEFPKADLESRQWGLIELIYWLQGVEIALQRFEPLVLATQLSPECVSKAVAAAMVAFQTSDKQKT